MGKFIYINENVHPISFRYTHHASPSGYDILCKYMGPAIQSKPIPAWLVPNRVIWRLAQGVILYDRHALALETKAILHSLTHSKQIYHFIYGENSYKYLGYFTNLRNNHVVASFHQPPELLENFIQSGVHLQKLSAIIVLGNSQLSYFRDKVDSSKIFFVPYGVDTDFFKPFSKKPPVSGTCLCVGNWLRDFQLLREVIRQVHQRNSKVKFIIITNPENFTYLTDLPVEIHSGISDQRLLELYQSSTLLLLPLKELVASTSLLEALSSGLPVILNDIGSARDYVNEKEAILTPPGDASAMSDAIIYLIENPDLREEMSKSCRKQALNFSWPRIIERLDKVYTKIMC